MLGLLFQVLFDKMIFWFFRIQAEFPNNIIRVHGTLKLENRNWKFGLHAFVLLMNAFNFGPSLSTIVLYPLAFDSDKTFLLMSFRNHDLVSSNEPLEYRYRPLDN
ncbi:MAG: hypothetical protein BA868_02960 [Desulfobacterales bacterium C00003106]|nr:MAG: hypothetical protein BA868_02960 [Desulfobacterales bacterium C00003106]